MGKYSVGRVAVFLVWQTVDNNRSVQFVQRGCHFKVIITLIFMVYALGNKLCCTITFGDRAVKLMYEIQYKKMERAGVPNLSYSVSPSGVSLDMRTSNRK